jgi:DNA polymerase (family 10)
VTNTDIAATFEQIADLLEYQGDNVFRVRAYRNAARTIGGMVESLATVRADSKRSLTDLEGIGADLAEKIGTLLDTGDVPLLQELRKAVPAVVFELMRVPGLGPKKVKLLVDQLGIDSLDSLEQACRDQIVQELLVWMRGCPQVRQIEGAGSWRRGRETVGDLDLVVDSDAAGAVMDRLHAWKETSTVLLRGDTKTSVRGPQGVQIDLRVVDHGSFGAALQYFTGSKEHNVRLRSWARDRGLTMNEYGVYEIGPESKGDAKPSKAACVAGATEQDVYAAVGLPWVPPELREGRDEILRADRGELPELVDVADVRGDLHMHTTATDGEDTLAEMVRAAIARGLRYIAITDHGQRVTMARGLDKRRLLKQWDEIDQLNAALGEDGRPPIVVLKGIEVDMLEKGGLDLPDEVLEKADWVVASLHYGQNQPRERITARIIEAIENPHVSVIGHPTGRLLNKRPPYDVDIEAVIDAAARTGTFLEINANPWRLDLNEHHAAAAKKAGVKVVISTDAHSTRGLDLMRCGVLQARRAGLEAGDVANTRTLAGLRKLMKR